MNLITGASGFVGQRLLCALRKADEPCRGLTRSAVPAKGIDAVDLADLSALATACTGVARVFHCAGYSHAFSALSGADAELHRRVNFEGTRNLAVTAGAAGVERFVFLSSVKAMAEPGEICADEDFPGAPATAYGQAKRAAEAAVLEAGRRYGMQVVNLRLAMVYGAGGRGNLERMARLIRRGLFPPLPETGNHRSIVHVDDVVAAMRLVADDVRAAGRTYIVAAREAPSGRMVYDALRSALGLRPRVWAVPEAVLWAAARLGDGLEALLGRRMPLDGEVVERLLGSAWYSPARIEAELGWRAQVSLAAGLAEMCGTGGAR